MRTAAGHREEGLPGTGRQEPEHRLRRRRSGRGPRLRADRACSCTPARSARPARGCSSRTRSTTTSSPNSPGGPTRSGSATGFDPDTETGRSSRAAPRQGRGLRSARRRAGRPAPGRRLAAGRSGVGQGFLPPAHRVRRLHPGHDDRAGRDVRPDRHRGALHRRGRGDRAGQRHRLRPGRRRVDPGRGARRTGRRGPAARHGVDQRLPPLPARGGVGRVQAVGHRPRTRAVRPARIPGGQAHLPQHPRSRSGGSAARWPPSPDRGRRHDHATDPCRSPSDDSSDLESSATGRS